MTTDARITSNARLARVLVTGAAGFIGSHLVDALLARGHAVIGLDRRSPVSDAIAATNLSQAAANPNFTYTVGDLNTADVTSLAKGCDTVFHLAAVPGVRASWGERFHEYAAVNVVGTHRLLRACQRANVRRLVLASSSSVYGVTTTPSREGDRTRPVSPYAVTKLAAEQLCLAQACTDDAHTSVVALRYFTVYGPRQRPDMAIGRILAAALTGEPFALFGDGSQRRDFTYVSDAVDATLAAAHCSARDAVVNVGGGEPTTMRDLLAIASQVIGRPVSIARADVKPGDVPATAADLTRARSLLGYRPQVDLRTGIQRQLDWLIDQRRTHPPDTREAVTR